MGEQDPTGANAPSRQPYIDRGEPLPQSYAENRLVAMIRDPEHVFAYWDVESDVRVAGGPVVVRTHCLSEGQFYDTEPGVETNNWYLCVASNRTYRLELYERLHSGELRLLASSGEVTTPLRWSGESGGRPPAEIIHAERHPMTRGAKTLRPPIIRPAPPGPVPVPVTVAVPAPTAGILGSAYVRGT